MAPKKPRKPPRTGPRSPSVRPMTFRIEDNRYLILSKELKVVTGFTLGIYEYEVRWRKAL